LLKARFQSLPLVLMLALIVGGVGPSGPVAQAEACSSSLNVFSSLGSLHTPRGDPAAILLQNGQVLVAGGYDGTTAPLASAELYNRATGTFTQLAAQITTPMGPENLVPLSGSWICSFTSATSGQVSGGVFELTPTNRGAANIVAGNVTIVGASKAQVATQPQGTIVLPSSNQSGNVSFQAGTQGFTWIVTSATVGESLHILQGNTPGMCYPSR
jgi:hypothetical protein